MTGHLAGLITRVARILVCLGILCFALGWGQPTASAQPLDLLRQSPILKVVNLGTEDGQLVFDPDKIIFRSGTLYTLKLVNPSPLKHYFTAKDFADAIWTQKVEVAGAEIKGHINNIELKSGSSLEWTFLPIRSGSYDLICTVVGHKDAGMVGQIVISS